jgi:hypothetical protein
VGAESIVECLGGAVEAVEGLLEGPHVFFAVFVVCPQSFRKAPKMSRPYRIIRSWAARAKIRLMVLALTVGA